jgi:uncharacterized protein (TIGR02246 family)
MRLVMMMVALVAALVGGAVVLWNGTARVESGVAAAAPDDAVSERLQRLEDEAEIRGVLLDYGRHLDDRDFAAYASLFARDGEWVGGFGSVAEPANIEAFMEENLGTGPNTAGSYHLLSNFVIEVEGDTATAWSRWTFVTPGERGAAISQAGRYDDTLVREDGRWRFQRREASNDTGRPRAN